MDFLNPNAKYEIMANNVPRVNFATGGFLQNSPIVCGGRWQWNYSQDCVVVGQPEMEMKMIEKREYAASVALDQRTLWIVGGQRGLNGIPVINVIPGIVGIISLNNCLNSTEFIKLGQPSVKGPNLPFRVAGHSMIQYDKNSIYIIGGVQNGRRTNKTWIVNLTNGFQIKKGPCLNKRRSGHVCAKMNFKGRTILVVAGGYNGGWLDSVEILDPSGNNVWTPGMFS